MQALFIRIKKIEQAQSFLEFNQLGDSVILSIS